MTIPSNERWREIRHKALSKSPTALSSTEQPFYYEPLDEDFADHSALPPAEQEWLAVQGVLLLASGYQSADMRIVAGEDAAQLVVNPTLDYPGIQQHLQQRAANTLLDIYAFRMLANDPSWFRAGVVGYAAVLSVLDEVDEQLMPTVEKIAVEAAQPGQGVSLGQTLDALAQNADTLLVAMQLLRTLKDKSGGEVLESIWDAFDKCPLRETESMLAAVSRAATNTWIRLVVRWCLTGAVDHDARMELPIWPVSRLPDYAVPILQPAGSKALQLHQRRFKLDAGRHLVVEEIWPKRLGTAALRDFVLAGRYVQLIAQHQHKGREKQEALKERPHYARWLASVVGAENDWMLTGKVTANGGGGEEQPDMRRPQHVAAAAITNRLRHVRSAVSGHYMTMLRDAYDTTGLIGLIRGVVLMESGDWIGAFLRLADDLLGRPVEEVSIQKLTEALRTSFHESLTWRENSFQASVRLRFDKQSVHTLLGLRSRDYTGLEEEDGIQREPSAQPLDDQPHLPPMTAAEALVLSIDCPAVLRSWLPAEVAAGLEDLHRLVFAVVYMSERLANKQSEIMHYERARFDRARAQFLNRLSAELSSLAGWLHAGLLAPALVETARQLATAADLEQVEQAWERLIGEQSGVGGLIKHGEPIARFLNLINVFVDDDELNMDEFDVELTDACDDLARLKSERNEEAAAFEHVEHDEAEPLGNGGGDEA